jgi:hypothetical protein
MSGLREIQPDQLLQEYRRQKVRRFQETLSGAAAADRELDALGREFHKAHEHDPELCAWVYVNETPTPRGAGSLLFRQLAGRGALQVCRVETPDAWKQWLDVLIGYLLSNDAGEEYIRAFPAGRRECSEKENSDGSEAIGENYEIRQLFRASELYVSWLLVQGRGKRQAADHSARAAQGNPDPGNELAAAMARNGLNAPQLAHKVRALLQRKGMARIKVDRTTIYRIVQDKTKKPNPAILAAIRDVLNSPAEKPHRT